MGTQLLTFFSFFFCAVVIQPEDSFNVVNITDACLGRQTEREHMMDH